jgi:murein DD-endopeptidase MepM/ murein hydrolase activator NlpD
VHCSPQPVDPEHVRLSVLVGVSTLTLSAPALASNGGMAVPDTASGGVVYGQAVRKVPARPVLRRFAVDLHRVLVRVDRRGARRVDVSMRLRRGHANSLITRTIPTGRRVAIALPPLGPGHWTIRLRVKGLARVRRGRLLVHGIHTPSLPADGGVFPVAGPHTYGDGIGAKRKGHRHQGVDVLAAQGTPVVAPVAGTVLYVDFQAHGAGYYVVEQAVDGRAFFFAHCQKGSFAVAPNATVAAGQRLCLVGHSGDARGPHLHFEIWIGGWRVDRNSQFIDPLPTLKSWDRA